MPHALRPFSLRRCVLIAAVLCAAVSSPAAFSEWKEANGKTFKGEPADILGPFALFHTGATGGRTVMLHTLSKEDCVRLHTELTAAAVAAAGANPVAGDDGSGAPRGCIAREIDGRVLRLRGGKLQPENRHSRPEPSVYVLLSLSPRDGGALSRIVNALFLQYQRIQKVYPNQLEAVYFSRTHSTDQYLEIARSRRMPWLVADPKKMEAMKTFERIAPFEGNFVVALSRNGVPILSAGGHDEEALTRFMDQLASILSLIQPDNLRNWRDRHHYLTAVRPVQHAEGSGEALFLGHPLRPETLRKVGISQIRAQLQVSAEGKIGQVRLARGPGIDEKVAPGLAEALRRSLVMLPAIEKGQPVESQFQYRFDVPKADPESEAIVQWLNLDPSREYPIKEWLVLKTFKVEQQGFLEVSHVTEDGVTVFKPVKALQGRAKEEADLKSQKSAFAYDWFSAEECATLRPTAGLRQKIDGSDYTWQRFKPDGRSVELNTGWDKEQYCYCYAWAEIEVDQDQPALLGLGSDDGVKVWLNGEVLVEKWAQRPLRIDEDVLPLRLKKGRNQLLLKVQNIWGEWRFSCRLILQGTPPRPPAQPTAK